LEFKQESESKILKCFGVGVYSAKAGVKSESKISDSVPVLNMIRFPDRDPTEICNSEPDLHWTGFLKNLTGSDMNKFNQALLALKT